MKILSNCNCINLSIQPSFELVSLLRYHESGMRDRSILVIHLACGEAPLEMGAFSTGTATYSKRYIVRNCHLGVA